LIAAFHKPYGVLSQFTPDGSPHRTLAEFGFPKNIHPVGRLDADSEGLLLLSDEPAWNQRLLDPRHHVPKTYLVLVERRPEEKSLARLRAGVVLDAKRTLPAEARICEPQPVVPPRDPPVRFRKTVEDVWIEIRLREGRNRQVRRMTAAIGHPTLRLLRIAIGRFELPGLPLGQWRELDSAERALLLEDRGSAGFTRTQAPATLRSE
jgi:23S rRNA pseudouridine2457 synthase